MNKLYITLIVIFILLFIPLSSYAHEDVADQSNTQVVYDEKTTAYFLDISMGFEYGSASKVIRKWNEDIRIKVTGTPSVADMVALFRTVTELNDLVGDKINISIVQEDEYSNVEIYFGKVSTFRSKARGYVPGNWGYFEVLYGSDNYIREALILESTDMPTQKEKFHLLKEEVSQILGLANDSYKYPDSIFYGEYGDVQDYSELDKKIIQMLYLDNVKVGMDKNQIEEVFRELNNEILNKQ